MRPLRITLLVLVSALALVASACGGSQDVPAGAIAVVDGTEIPKSELDALVAMAKKRYEGQKDTFPKVGTPEYQQLQQQYVAFLVQRAELRKEADKLGIEVTEQDIDKAVEDLVKDRFDGKREELDKALKQQGFTLALLRETLEVSVLQQKLFDEVTKDAEVTEEEILLSYTQNQSQYEQVDFAKSKAEAERIRKLLVAGGDFEALAKENSDDPGSKDQGGKLDITRGQTVPPFDRAAFSLAVGAISEPIRTIYGYHLIEPLSPVKPGTGGSKESREVRHILISEKRAKPLDEVRDVIRTNLLQEKRDEIMREWIENLTKRYESKISYAEGYAPPALPDVPDETE